MGHKVTLFTGQWADLPLAELCAKAAAWGYDGLELACAGDHFEVDRALTEDGYVDRIRMLLAQHGLECFCISNHLVGECVCALPLDARHQAVVPTRIWGDGDADGVRERATKEMQDTARAAAKLGVTTVVGFTGSSIWHFLTGFPPVVDDGISAGYQDFADRWNPILDVFDQVGVRFALEVHPGEIAYDYWTTRRALAAIGHRAAFGINYDPSHLVWQMVDPEQFVLDFGERIFHVHVKESKRNHNGRNGALASHLAFGDMRRGWDFVSPGRGDVPFDRVFRALNSVGYPGPLSIEWEDSGMHRDQGAPEALGFVQRTDLAASDRSFDAAFARAD